MGTILPWYGDLNAIPSGFLYCDGTNGTPDLRGRTLVGSGAFSDSFGNVSYSLGDMAGERLHRITIAEMPSHDHASGGARYSGVITTRGDGGFPTTGLVYNSNSAFNTGLRGADQPHNNMMPYVVLHWIIKI